MYYSGFADEAGSSIEVQIKATQELGWQNIESRSIDGINLTDVSDAQFESICEKLESAGVRINCFGSAIANWSKDPRSPEDYRDSKAALERAIPRMQRLGTRYLRGMSFKIIKDAQPDSPEIEKLVFEKVSRMVKLCEDSGVLYLHENCMNYGGLSYLHTLRLLDAINSPNFRLVFDTGNPVGSDRHIGTAPYPKQSAWEFYTNVREFIEYVHIKDCKFIAETDGLFPELEYTFPGDGDGDVYKIVTHLLQSGYGGGLSIEPHLGSVVFHESGTGKLETEDDVRYANYVEYGRRFMRMVKEINIANE
jgi:sugar phosphate isomerase/epimerase